MNRISKYVDEYDFRSRYVPALLITFPALVAIFALLPDARSWYGAMIGPAVEVALVLILVRIARDEGTRIQPQLVQEWDGIPTTRFLRHRNDELEQPTRERYKATLERLVGIKFPSAEEESLDPLKADAIYASAISGLRERRRGKSYRLVFLENCNYGMMRNLLGLRFTGLGIALLAALAVLLGLLLPSTSKNLVAFTIIVCLFEAFVLMRFVTKASVKRTAEAYATALLRTCQPTSAR